MATDEVKAQTAVTAFAEGFFEVIEALLSTPVEHEAGPLEPVTAEALSLALTELPVIIESVLGDSVPAILFEVKDALRLSGMVFGQSDKTSERLADFDLASLKELGGHAMQGGVGRIARIVGRPMQLGDVKAGLSNPLAVQRLSPLLEGRSLLARFRFRAQPDLDAQVAFVLPDDFASEDQAPPEVPEAEAPVGNELFAELSPSKELRMTPEPEFAAPQGSLGAPREAAGNLDMILDIRLVVRARLGRVELPIADVLALGPGSIVEVGRMLDEPVDLLVNDKLIARGDIVVVDEKFGLRITEIVSPRERIESLR